ncbi:MAG: glycoside hydrolase family 3 C-terminal domain-containing protein [Actinomycetota bacterium]|nr:glycoside hydrolase family 3 C-terminal domain-containing protein [Actinomycetota bacterium]
MRLRSSPSRTPFFSRRTVRNSTLALAGVSLLAATVSMSPWRTPRTSLSTIPLNAEVISTNCPWVAESLHHSATASSLATQVADRMTPSELANFVVLRQQGPIENINVGVPRLCIPAITLIDGPGGVGGNLTGVTQFPSEISLASTFNPSITTTVGRAMALEALRKGFDVLQAPDLNLVRSPLSGRSFETYGEDPFLASVMGVAAVEGIQSTGVMAQAKHLGAYTQENARARINQVVSQRVMTEIYNAPFQAAVTQAHVASVMCAMGSLNGVNTCSTSQLYATLRSWGFTGFVRSDYDAVVSPAPAFQAGLSLLKPATAAQVTTLMSTGQLAAATLRTGVRSVLTQMFAFGLVAHPRTLNLNAPATNQADQTVALQAARQSIVLLKNASGVLPLSPALSSLAVIGVGASDAVVTRGGGSSGVHASSLTTPLVALRSQFPHAAVSYSPGGLPALEFDPLNAADIVGGKAPPSEVPVLTPSEPGKADLAIDYSKSVTPAALTATRPGTGEGWSNWDVSFIARKTGTYVIGLENIGDTFLTLNSTTIIADRGIHGPYPQSVAVNLVAGTSYQVVARWFSVGANSTPRFGIDFVQPQINAAVAAAKKAGVAVVFASDLLTEGADMPSLSLQGNLNALIEAVAAVNPRTVVVLDTGGAVLTPWRSKVAAIVEAWYPGQQGAQAITQVLSGVIDPSGRLPVTMPATEALTPTSQVTRFPGHNGVVDFGALSDIGYRWYLAHAVTPAYPFGYGLSYTNFTHSHVVIARHGTGARVSLDVTNTGARKGVDVVQVYVSYPATAGEPPQQLRAFSRITLASRQSSHVVIDLTRNDFTYVSGATPVLASGSYVVSVGTSSASFFASSSLSVK